MKLGCQSYLKKLLGGDELVASLLLLHLLSSTVSVKDAKIGKLSLNIANFPSPQQGKPNNDRVNSSKQHNMATQRLAKGLSELVPWCVTMPLTISTLNKADFQPNAEQGDLTAGALQLAQKTILVCDETELEEGMLQEKGVRNLKALQRIALEQSLTYQFPFQPIEIATNIRLVVTSAGKSLIKLDISVPLSDEAAQNLRESTQPQAPPTLDGQQYHGIRSYLLYCQGLEYEIPKEVSEVKKIPYH